MMGKIGTGLVFLCLLQAVVSQAPGVTCKDHPVNTDGKLTSTLIRAWKTPEKEGAKIHDNAYIARVQTHAYAPLENLKSKQWFGYDMFFLVFTSARFHFNIGMWFQRKAKVHIYVDVRPSSFHHRMYNDTPALSGWKSEGWAVLVKGSTTMEYGIHQTGKRHIPQVAYVFSKLSGGAEEKVEIPSSEDILKSLKNIQVKGAAMNIWVSEADGSPPKEMSKYDGKSIKPNTRCPDKLHDEWFTYDSNPEDKDTKGVKFPTWHPAWDPCFWCAYDHEHGSSPKQLMGYVPKYGYTAWKFNRQNEQHEGFKGFVVEVGKYMLYYNTHVTASNIRRVTVRFHTVLMTVIEKKTGKLQYEVTHKGDYGFLAARRVNKVGFIPLNKEDEEIQKELEAKKLPRRLRSINVINPKLDKLRTDFQYRPQGLLVGAYEEWTTDMQCMKTKMFSPIAVDVETSPTGIEAADRLDKEVKLGRWFNGTFVRNVGVNRSFRLSDITLGGEFCNFTNSDKTPDGYFYTDPYGMEVRPGPGKTSVRQYIRPGFKLHIKKKFETLDPWLGMYTEGVSGFFRDHGFGIDPARN